MTVDVLEAWYSADQLRRLYDQGETDWQMESRQPPTRRRDYPGSGGIPACRLLLFPDGPIATE